MAPAITGILLCKRNQRLKATTQRSTRADSSYCDYSERVVSLMGAVDCCCVCVRVAACRSSTRARGVMKSPPDSKTRHSTTAQPSIAHSLAHDRACATADMSCRNNSRRGESYQCEVGRPSDESHTQTALSDVLQALSS